MFRHEDYATERTSHGVYERQQNKAEYPSDACYRAGVIKPSKNILASDSDTFSPSRFPIIVVCDGTRPGRRLATATRLLEQG